MRARAIVLSALTLILAAGTPAAAAGHADDRPERSSQRQTQKSQSRAKSKPEARSQPAPRTRATRPSTRTIRPTTRAATPTTRGVTPRSRAASPTTRPITPNTRSVTPSTRVIRPPTRAVSPSTRPVSPGTRTITPTTRAITPTARAITPARNDDASRPSGGTRTITRPTRQERQRTNRPAGEQRQTPRPTTSRPAPQRGTPATRDRATQRPVQRPSARPAIRPTPDRVAPVRPDTRPTREPIRPNIVRPAPSRPGAAEQRGNVRIEPLPPINADRGSSPSPGRPGSQAGRDRGTTSGVVIDRVRARSTPEIHTALGRRAESRGRPAPRPGSSDIGPGRDTDFDADTRRGSGPGDRDGHHGDHGHHGHHGHHHYDHGSCYTFWDYGWGLWVGFRWSDWYYCPPYRRTTYIYVSPTYESHYYYGAGTGLSADNAVSSLERGWHALERGAWTSARRRFAEASRSAPDWGLPKIGYALALAATGNDRGALPLLRRAFAEDPYAALEVPWSPEIESLLLELDARYTGYAETGVSEPDAWFLASVMRLLLNDPDAAADAAFNAEASGDRSEAINGLLDVLAGSPSALP